MKKLLIKTISLLAVLVLAIGIGVYSTRSSPSVPASGQPEEGKIIILDAGHGE